MTMTKGIQDVVELGDQWIFLAGFLATSIYIVCVCVCVCALCYKPIQAVEGV